MDSEQLRAIALEEVGMISKVLPEEISQAAANCTVHFEDKPDDEFEDPELLGCFEGSSLIDDPDPSAPARIRLFLENLWDYAGNDEQDFRDEVGTTYLHELGHYLGWDEDEIAERGLE
ncbi:MAG: metallopeptidase family protein [Luteolibacter sp.]